MIWYVQVYLIAGMMMLLPMLFDKTFGSTSGEVTKGLILRISLAVILLWPFCVWSAIMIKVRGK